MAHFAELDSDNKVLRVVKGCNQDIANNGGEQSEQAAEHFKTVCPLSKDGVKWVQTSYNKNFRKNFAGFEFSYDPVKDIFLEPKPYPSWILDTNNNWQAPVANPNDDFKQYIWNEQEQNWVFVRDIS